MIEALLQVKRSLSLRVGNSEGNEKPKFSSNKDLNTSACSEKQTPGSSKGQSKLIEHGD